MVGSRVYVLYLEKQWHHRTPTIRINDRASVALNLINNERYTAVLLCVGFLLWYYIWICIQSVVMSDAMNRESCKIGTIHTDFAHTPAFTHWPLWITFKPRHILEVHKQKFQSILEKSVNWNWNFRWAIEKMTFSTNRTWFNANVDGHRSHCRSADWHHHC